MKITKFFAFLRLLCLTTLLASMLPAQAQNTCQSRPFNTYEQSVSAAYIAYYGRPADTGGLAYWAGQLAARGGDLGAIIDAFGNSAEYRQRFGSLSNRELIRNLYQQLYGRDPDMAGWAFYEMWLDTGVQSLASIAISIMDGTEGGDTAILDNRKTVARHFITRMEALGAAAPAITDGSLLADLMAATDGSAASRENACAQVNTLIEAQSTTTTVLTMAAHEAGASGAINNLSGAVGSERFFKLMVPAGVTDLVIRTARTAGGMGDVDLYVSRGVRPAPGNADCSSGAWFSADEQCSFATPVAGEYFILLRGAIVDYSGVTLSASWRGSGPPPEIEILTGFFRDSAVKGLDYASCPVPLNPAACITGQTGADGEYEYRNGDRVRFTLGQLVVAQAAAAPLHTPTTISKSQDEATKLAQFLQSIDENSDPKDGIHISPETRARAQNSALVQQGQTDFSLNLNRIPNMVSVLTPGRAVVGPTEAQAHAEASQRLLAMSVTDVGQWILGKKQLPSSSNVGVLSTSARERLRLAMWYRVKGNLQARADGLSNNVDDLERKKNQRAAYVDLTQSLVEAGLLMGNVKGMENMNIDELTIEIINNHISIATATLKVADIDIESYSDTTKGILNAVGGKWSGALKDGAKGGAGFIFSSEPVNKSIAEFFISDLFGTFIDVADDCLPYVKGNKCALGTIKAKIITGQSAKAIKAVNDLYASYQLFSNDIHLTTYIAAIDYLNNYYLQAGDQQRLADIYGVNADPYTMVWMSKKFSSMMDQLLFENLVAETKSSVEQLYAIYSDALGASNADTYAQVDGIGDIVCNGTEDTLSRLLKYCPRTRKMTTLRVPHPLPDSK